MAKQCDVCKLFYPEDVTTCPHCAGVAGDETVPLLSDVPKMPPPGQIVPGFHGIGLEGSEVDLASPFVPEAPPVPPMIGKKPEQVRSMLAKETDEERAPRPMSRAGKPVTMLAAAQDPTTGDISEEQKKTQMAKGSAHPTMIAPPDALIDPKATMLAPADAQLDPKATKLAPQGAQPTMLAQPGEKKTQLASGAAPTTKLAKPDEMAALAKEGVPAAKTQLAAGATPMTKLARPDEQDQLALPEAKRTQLAAGAAPMTKLARPNEQDQLALPVPVEPEDEADYDLASSKIDLGSSGRLPHVAEIGPDESVEETRILTEEIVEEVRAQKPPKGKMLVGGLLGMVLGSAACLALAVFDLLPVASLQNLTGMKKPIKPGPSDGTDLAAAVLHLDNGHFDKALLILDQLDDGAAQAKRGQARWLQYLQQQKQANAPFNKDDAAVGKARADLSNASNAESKFWLGHMEEVLAGRDAARKVYQEGLTQYKDQERLFQSALDRLDATADAKGPGAHLFVPDLPGAAPLLFLFAQAAVPADEAGADFWRAAKLAKEQKFAEAVAALQQARATHDRQRYLRLRKAQNPTSDPTEEIFLRSSDELLTYWKFLHDLKDRGYTDLAGALEVLKDKDAGATLAKIVDLIKKADPEVKDVPKSLEALLAAKKQADMQLDVIKKALDNPEDVAKAAEKALDERKAYLDALTKTAATLKIDQLLDVPQNVDTLAKAKVRFETGFKAADGTLKDIHKNLVAAQIKGMAPEVKYENVLAGVQTAIDEAYAPVVKALASVSGNLGMFGNVAGRQIGHHVDLSASLSVSQARNARFQTLLLQSRTPHQMLDYWLPLLQERGRKDLADKAAQDARNVLKDKQAEADVRAQARCVEGLALRNQGKYDDARQAIADALQAPKQVGWLPFAQFAQQELSDPAAYYLPLADSLRAAGKYAEALAVVGAGLEVFPKEAKSGRLLALRSLIQLDLAKAQAKGNRLVAKDGRVEAAAKDAEAALAAGAKADGLYAQGRVAEELGQWAKAQQSFRAALAALPANEPATSKFRVALARVLLRIPEVPLEDQPEMPKEDKKIGLVPATTPTIAYSPLSGQVAQLLLTAAGDDEADTPTPELDEAIRLADQAIQAGNFEGHLVKGLALAKKGRWTDAILEYAVGLEKLGRNPEDAKGLRFLMQNHPAFKIPDGQQPADPLTAEKHYAAGLRLYWSRRYDDAEREFFHAVRHHDQDARFLYFLGLSRLNQGKTAFAVESFRRAGMLEQQNKPASAAVSATLERIQGHDRQVLNRYRP